ncbi:hypothetical protein BKA65DRAFT_559731 [Rhexocercosporidium sp. MPI-PUGE-AT-0058]|nr:hypothetical protein BKA65DRAFT_559731 [Rhexocercosporidium sp. MPI-PUGE-AT-0058]
MVAPPLTVVVRVPVLVEVVLVADNEVDGLGAGVIKAVLVEDVVLEDVILDDVELEDGRNLLLDNVVLSEEDSGTDALETRVFDEGGLVEAGDTVEGAVFVEVENDECDDALEDISFEEEGLTEDELEDIPFEEKALTEDDVRVVVIAPDTKDEDENEENDFEEAIFNEEVLDDLIETPLDVAASTIEIKVPTTAKSAAVGRSMANNK